MQGGGVHSVTIITIIIITIIIVIITPYHCGEDVNIFVAVDQNWNKVLLDHLERNDFEFLPTYQHRN